jgi:transcription elongation factor GreB
VNPGSVRAAAPERGYAPRVSKAFTSEETPDLGPIARPAPRLAPGERRYVTPEGHAELRAEAERLRAARTPDSDARLALVEATLAALTVLGPGEAPEGVAVFATWVTVEEPDGARRTWRLVGPDEADARRGLLSVHAPLGRALLGHRAGDVVEVQRPSGPLELTVVEVRRTGP